MVWGYALKSGGVTTRCTPEVSDFRVTGHPGKRSLFPGSVRRTQLSSEGWGPVSSSSVTGWVLIFVQTQRSPPQLLRELLTAMAVHFSSDGFHSPPHIEPLTVFLPPLPQCSLSLGGNDTNVLFGADHLAATYSGHLVKPQISVSITVPWKERLLWLRLSVVTVHGHKHIR